MKLIFERSVPGHRCTVLPSCDVPYTKISPVRQKALKLPELTENEISRHYTALAGQIHGVNSGFYPLGSCTMKYNPKINDEAAALPGFTDIHPMQPDHTVQGALDVMKKAEKLLCEITGMDAMTFQPAAGSHGEMTGLLLMKAWHASKKDFKRKRVIIPDSAHGTNPASATMAGYTTVSVPSNADGGVDLEALQSAVGEDTAGLMLTNPNTLGIFDPHIQEITRIIHKAGGLCYYDGANLNAVMGLVRPGDMGFDIVHLNLHKTFSTPHGGGGPGSGPVGCKQFLAEFLPGQAIIRTENHWEHKAYPQSYGSVKAFYGHFLVVVRALCYLMILGREGIPEAAEQAVLNANYMKKKLESVFRMAYHGFCMHEFVMTLEKLKKENGVSALDMAKGMLDYGVHPPTMYFPLIVHEALMAEPTETESKGSIDEAVQIYKELYQRALNDPDALHNAPVRTPVRRPDEVEAARHPRLRWEDQHHD
jgi:glycine dehydrogenase subunit 2